MPIVYQYLHETLSFSFSEELFETLGLSSPFLYFIKRMKALYMSFLTLHIAISPIHLSFNLFSHL